MHRGAAHVRRRLYGTLATASPSLPSLLQRWRLQQRDTPCMLRCRRGVDGGGGGVGWWGAVRTLHTCALRCTRHGGGSSSGGGAAAATTMAVVRRSSGDGGVVRRCAYAPPHVTTRRACSSRSSSSNNDGDDDASTSGARTAVDDAGGVDTTTTTATATATDADAGTAADTTARPQTPGKVRVRVVDERGRAHDVAAPVGMTLMEAIRDVARLDIEAACDGTCTCSTCHVVLTPASYAAVLREQAATSPSEDEMDMLDVAPHVTRTSRLSCQITLTAGRAGVEAQLPRTR